MQRQGFPLCLFMYCEIEHSPCGITVGVKKHRKCVSLNWFCMAWVRIAAGFHLGITADPGTCAITSCSGIPDFMGHACVSPAENLGA